MFYVWHGPNQLGQTEALAALKQQWGDPSMLDVNTTELNGKQLALSDLKNASGVVPFLAPVRLVLVDGFFGRKPDKTTVDSLLDYLPTLPDTTHLFFLEAQKIAQNSRILKSAEQADNGQHQLFELPQGADLNRWVMQRARAKGGQIEPNAAAVLAANVGNQLGLLNNELEKLVVFSDQAPITVETVNLLCPHVAEANIFALVDALGMRNGPKASQLLQQKLADGTDPFYLFSMFTRQFRLMIQVKELAETGAPPPQIAKEIKQHSFVVGKIYNQARRFSLRQLERIYQHLLDIDVDVKTGQNDMRTALTLFVAALASS